MNLKTYLAAYKPFKEKLYELLVSAIECGPFDGGCVACALALQKVLGGTVVVLTRPDGTADHAALLYRKKLWDMDGPLVPARFLQRFNRVELSTWPWKCAGYRALQDDDLPEAPRDPELVAKLAAILEQFLAPEMDVKTIAKVKKLTADNAHTHAYMHVAKRLGLPKLYWAFNTIATEAERAGELSADLDRKRYGLYRQMMEYAKANLPEALYTQLYQAL